MIIQLHEVEGLYKYSGLMFQRDPKALVFRFPKYTTAAIHSLFCKPFLAIWMKNGEHLESKLIGSGVLEIKPIRAFDTLIEIPLVLLEA